MGGYFDVRDSDNPLLQTFVIRNWFDILESLRNESPSLVSSLLSSFAKELYRTDQPYIVLL